MTYHAVSYFASGDVPERLGSGHASVAPYGAFPTSDGYLVVAVATDALWKRFCGALGHEELIDDERFRTNPLRCQNRDEALLAVDEHPAELDAHAGDAQAARLHERQHVVGRLPFLGGAGEIDAAKLDATLVVARLTPR